MPSTIKSAVRDPLVATLNAAGIPASCYSFVPESPIVPFVAIVPSIPYLEPNLIGNDTVRMKINFAITIGVEPFDNDASLDNIEQIMVKILAALPSGYEVGEISNPVPFNLNGGAYCIAAEINVSTQYTQTL